jgi:hypothetical protein
MGKAKRVYTKTCRLCNSEFSTGSWDKKYCSKECKAHAFSTGFADYDCGRALCAHCGSEFKKKHLRHAYCSDTCKSAAAKARGGVPTEQQYARLSGNWRKYLNRLCTPALRSQLTTDDLLQVLEVQNYMCALTGVPLTCVLVKGARTWTNASIDRIVAGGPYTPSNIRLTCVRINILRGNMTDGEFVHWCKLVVNHMENDDA